MKTLLAIVVLLFATVALAQGPVVYPPETRNMTAEQFRVWAEAKNVQLRAEWQAKKDKAVADQPQYVQGSTTDDSMAWTVTRSNYNQDAVCGGLYNPRPAFDTSGNVSSSQRTLPIQYDNPKYVNPGPLTVVNPYCPPPATPVPDIRYEDVVGEEHTVRSSDGKTLHFKVSP